MFDRELRKAKIFSTKIVRFGTDRGTHLCMVHFKLGDALVQALERLLGRAGSGLEGVKLCRREKSSASFHNVYYLTRRGSRREFIGRQWGWR